jgi:hypothetical protein
MSRYGPPMRSLQSQSPSSVRITLVRRQHWASPPSDEHLIEQPAQAARTHPSADPFVRLGARAKRNASLERIGRAPRARCGWASIRARSASANASPNARWEKRIEWVALVLWVPPLESLTGSLQATRRRDCRGMALRPEHGLHDRPGNLELCRGARLWRLGRCRAGRWRELHLPTSRSHRTPPKHSAPA